jgi:hypothetical protein
MHPEDFALLAFLLLLGAVALVLFFWTGSWGGEMLIAEVW